MQGDARVISCFRAHRQKLSHGCQQILVDFDIRMAESIDYNPPAKWFCASEISRYCPRADDVWGHHVMHCLRGSQANGNFTQGCLAVRRPLLY